MRSAPALVLIVLLAGCARPTPDAASGQGDGPPAVEASQTFYLKAAYKMSTTPPSKPSPDRVAANPMVNGFANEDLRVFESAPLERALNVTRVHLVAHYEVVAPTLDPFPNTTNPQEARQIVFWVGSGGLYPASVSTLGDTVLVPGRAYRAEATLVLPRPGWIIDRGERLQLLVATLAVNDRGAELRFLVDSAQTPSRLELGANTTDLRVPAQARSESKDYEIVANSGMFTGATADRLPSKQRIPILVTADLLYLEVRVTFRSNAGGKSDLDFDLFGPNGTLAAVSSTPYQSEALRLFSPNLGFHGRGAYIAEIVAYSGTNTKFSLETRTLASP